MLLSSSFFSLSQNIHCYQPSSYHPPTITVTTSLPSTNHLRPRHTFSTSIIGFVLATNRRSNLSSPSFRLRFCPLRPHKFVSDCLQPLKLTDLQSKNIYEWSHENTVGGKDHRSEGESGAGERSSRTRRCRGQNDREDRDERLFADVRGALYCFLFDADSVGVRRGKILYKRTVKYGSVVFVFVILCSFIISLFNKYT